MSEYWKSTPKYWCKHCSAFVKDTPFERKQHENTAKHQNGLKRFLRDIQNGHERGERDKERARAEVDRLKDIAGAESTKISGHSAAFSKPTIATTQTRPSAPASTADRKRQWAQLADMGIKVPDGYRTEMAMAGDWQTVSQQVHDDTASAAPLNKGIKRRKQEGQDEDDEEKDAAGAPVGRRVWGASTRTYPGNENIELDDLLTATVSVKDHAGPSKFQTKTKESRPIKQEENPAIEPDEPALGNYTSTPGEQPCLENGDETKPVKQESELDQTSRPKDPGQEQVLMPVFKKRKAKIP